MLECINCWFKMAAKSNFTQNFTSVIYLEVGMYLNWKQYYLRTGTLGAGTQVSQEIQYFEPKHK